MNLDPLPGILNGTNPKADRRWFDAVMSGPDVADLDHPLDLPPPGDIARDLCMSPALSRANSIGIAAAQAAMGKPDLSELDAKLYDIDRAIRRLHNQAPTVGLGDVLCKVAGVRASLLSLRGAPSGTTMERTDAQPRFEAERFDEMTGGF